MKRWCGIILMMALSVSAVSAQTVPSDPQSTRQQLDKVLTSAEYSQKQTQTQWEPNQPKQDKPTDLSWLGRLLETLGKWGKSLSEAVGIFGKTVALACLAVMAWWLYRTRHIWLNWLGQIPALKRQQQAHIDVQDMPEFLQNLPPKNELMDILQRLLKQHDWLGALSLLYRATLGELSQRHQLPIGKHQTEDECVWLLKLSQNASPAEKKYFEQLVSLWRASAYGKKLPQGVAQQDYGQILTLINAWQRLYGGGV